MYIKIYIGYNTGEDCMENTLKAMNLGSNKPATHRSGQMILKQDREFGVKEVVNRSLTILCFYLQLRIN